MRPDKPKNPETVTVNKLIGICKPMDPAKTLKKNKNKTPIPILTMLWARKRAGLIGAPNNNNRTIDKIIMRIIIDDCNDFSPFSPFLSIYA